MLRPYNVREKIVCYTRAKRIIYETHSVIFLNLIRYSAYDNRAGANSTWARRAGERRLCEGAFDRLGAKAGGTDGAAFLQRVVSFGRLLFQPDSTHKRDFGAHWQQGVPGP